MQTSRRSVADAQPFFLVVTVALCVVTAIIMGMVRIATLLTLVGALAAVAVGAGTVLWMTVRLLGSDE